MLQCEATGDNDFRQSIEIVEDQGALFFELHSTDELARSMISRGEVFTAQDMLRACVDRFKTAVETPDLTLANQLLRQGI
ncbi:hypothetical protein AB833_21125 [Chromatiales bacterium (ex Bugula neritina AB1)]|nr:hypothetical protein AB833_21125 [Chromatiales bacterium (ex Bugula neritina AB1)]